MLKDVSCQIVRQMSEWVHMAPVQQLAPQTHWHHVLERILIEMRISMATFAEVMGVSRSTPYNWLRGKEPDISIGKLTDLAERLGVEVRLFYGTPLEAVAWLVENRPEIYDPGYDPSGEFLLRGKVAPRGGHARRTCDTHPNTRYNLLAMAA